MGEAVSLLLRLGLALCSGACPLGVEKGTWTWVNGNDNDNGESRVLETRIVMDVVFISIMRETDVACTVNIVLHPTLPSP